MVSPGSSGSYWDSPVDRKRCSLEHSDVYQCPDGQSPTQKKPQVDLSDHSVSNESEAARLIYMEVIQEMYDCMDKCIDASARIVQQRIADRVHLV